MSATVSNRIARNIISAMLNNSASVPEAIVKELQLALGGTNGYIFINKGEGESVICLYSTNTMFYTVGTGYKISELPETNQLDIFHRNDLIGIVSLSADILFEDESYEELVQNVICLALMRHVGKQQGHFFEIAIYKEIDDILRSTLHDVETISGSIKSTMQAVHIHNAALARFKKQTRDKLSNALNIICDALDYIDFEKNTVVIKQSSFDLSEVVQNTLRLLEITSPFEIKGATTRSCSVYTDQALVRQALIGILRRVKTQLAHIEIAPGDIVVEIVIHLTSNLKILDDSPLGHKDLGMQLAQTICRHLGGDLSKDGAKLVITLRGVQ